MPHVIGNHSVVRDGSNIVIEYADINSADTIRVVMNANSTSVISEANTNFVSLLNGDLRYELDYALSTSHTVSNPEDYATALSKLMNEPADKLVIAQGNIANKVVKHIFGINSAVGTSFEDIWVVGGDLNFLTSATIVETSSGDADDTVAGTGARVVTIFGLDSTGAEISEDINMNGETVVQSSNSYLRINKVVVKECGTYGGCNFDDITTQVTGGGSILARISGAETIDTATYGLGVSQLGLYSVPLNKTAFLTRLKVNSDSSKVVEIYVYCRSRIEDNSAPMSPRFLLWSNTSLIGADEIIFDSYIAIPHKSDIWFRAKGGDAQGGAVEVSMDLIIVDDIV